MTGRRLYQASAIAAEIAVPIAILAAWQVWTTRANDPMFPRLSTILIEFREMWLFSQVELHLVPSLTRILLGFFIAVAVGVVLGIPLGLSRRGRMLAMPHIEWWRAMPPPALIPISIVLLHSIGNRQKVAFIAFVCLFPILMNTIDGVRGIDPTLIDTARSYGMGRLERVKSIVVPAALPQIFAGMRISLPLAVIMMVLTEYFSSTSGVGYVLLISKNTFQLVPMWATILLIGLLGYLLNLLLMLIERRVLALAPRLAGGGGAVSQNGGPVLEIRQRRQDLRRRRQGDAGRSSDVSFAVADREFVCVVGPSGCGKTTLLKCVGGLLRPSSGEVLLRGKRVTAPPGGDGLCLPGVRAVAHAVAHGPQERPPAPAPQVPRPT